jgi:hypothetical protein
MRLIFNLITIKANNEIQDRYTTKDKSKHDSKFGQMRPLQ